MSRSTWCVGCGKKLMADGRCSTCDAWWASPLIAIGVPLLLIMTLLLGVGIRFLNQMALPGTAQIQYAAGSSYATPIVAPPARSVSPNTSRTARMDIEDVWASVPREADGEVRVRPARRVAERPITMAEQVHLRQWSDYVDTVVAADEARKESGRSPANRDVAADVAAVVAQPASR